MREEHSNEYGYRRHTDGQIVGWWRTTQERDRAVGMAIQEARKSGVTLVADLVERRKIITWTHPTTTRTVRPA